MSLLKESQHLKIPLKEIKIATNNFQVCIGKGGYGMVYKGELSISGKSTTVAVKRLNEQFGQGLKEFLIEIQLLTGQKHPNLITLLGYCDEGKEKIIVYEYAEHGSLDQYLRRSNTIHALTWPERLKICIDAARGLNHLHNHVGKHQTIIHRDIKSANILIDHNWVAKISDLGLSKLSLAGLNRSAVVSHACGTQGYCEPESFSTGIVKKESDVYSFGVVLFEVLCGRLCFTIGDDGLLFSAPLAKDYYKKEKLDEIVDLPLREQMSVELMHKFSTIAYECLQDDREQRPPINLVVKELEELLEIQLSSSTLEASSKISKPAFASTLPPTISSEANHVSAEINSHELEAELKWNVGVVWGKLISQYSRNPHIVMDRPTFTVGQGHQCDLWISDKNISKSLCSLRHIESQQGGASIVLLEITGGKGVVKVNGKPCPKRSALPLRAGDEVIFSSSGRHAYIFQQL